MFGINDNGSQQDGTSTSGAPPVVPPPVEPTVSMDTTMAMPMPDQPANDTAPVMPTNDPVPATIPSIQPESAPSTDAPVTEPVMPDPLAMKDESSTFDNSVNGVSQDSNYAVPDSPHITSNYSSKPGSTPPALNNEDELLDIKKQALNSLAPLVNELEQNPEEKFKTTMMLIQASDNADLVKDAFTAANAISDEKARAQALLDVVNEINYFTQAHQDAEV